MYIMCMTWKTDGLKKPLLKVSDIQSSGGKTCNKTIVFMDTGN